jgi:hypothetical protein
MNIIGPPSASLEVVQRKLREQNRSVLFVNEITPALYKEGLRYGVDPVLMIAQCAKETGWGTFPGKVKPWFNNTAGIKVHPTEQALYPGVTDGDNPLAHERFASWTMGARAQAQHLRRYAGMPVPDDEVVYPRHWVVQLYRLKTVFDLSGRWAPSPSYGSEIADIARTLIEVGL